MNEIMWRSNQFSNNLHRSTPIHCIHPELCAPHRLGPSTDLVATVPSSPAQWTESLLLHASCKGVTRWLSTAWANSGCRRNSTWWYRTYLRFSCTMFQDPMQQGLPPSIKVVNNRRTDIKQEGRSVYRIPRFSPSSSSRRSKSSRGYDPSHSLVRLHSAMFPQ
jgi:hypothetical protein